MDFTRRPELPKPSTQRTGSIKSTPLLDKLGETKTLTGPSGVYTNLELLAETGASFIYRAVKDGKRVVVKEIKHTKDLKVDELAKREGDVGKQLEHINLVRYLDYFVIDGTSFVVSELVEGKSLRQMHEDGKEYTNGEITKIVGQILDGLVYLHTHFSSPIIHRDLKPENILIENGTGRVVIVDLGYIHNKFSTGDTANVLALNSPGFTAPELLDPGAEITPKADLYSFGAVYLFLLTGETATYLTLEGNQVPGDFDAKHREVIEGCVQSEPSQH
ncbi:serine/threonine protein kinase [Candidatus Micrarchaeota archaeon]|nr:serine/threonine protein kinase [Candidatus Micrarchaeota archaeon]